MEKITKEQFLEAIKIVNEYRVQLERELFEANQMVVKNSIFQKIKKEDSIFSLLMSSRLRNQLNMYFKRNNIVIKEDTPVSMLCLISKKKIILQRNFGTALLMELEEICMCTGIKLMP